MLDARVPVAVARSEELLAAALLGGMAVSLAMGAYCFLALPETTGATVCVCDLLGLVCLVFVFLKLVLLFLVLLMFAFVCISSAPTHAVDRSAARAGLSSQDTEDLFSLEDFDVRLKCCPRGSGGKSVCKSVCGVCV